MEGPGGGGGTLLQAHTHSLSAFNFFILDSGGRKKLKRSSAALLDSVTVAAGTCALTKCMHVHAEERKQSAAGLSYITPPASVRSKCAPVFNVQARGV